ncbi:MAG: bifunctional helix-turn-helix transcriptional regulator/GNAT family N-acetyltransferase [Inquilinaceae bacterium]
MPQSSRLSRVDLVRRFNRFYTRRIGVLREGLLDSSLSLAEGRVIYELAHRDAATAADLVRDLGLDAGYLSRLLKGFESRGWIDRRPSGTDGRRWVVTLTEAGRQVFADIDARSRRQVGDLLDALPDAAQARLVDAMVTVETLLSEPEPGAVSYMLRPHEPGDIGWVIQRHGALYSQEYGFVPAFEALVAEIGARFLRDFDPDRERCWIAERGGQPVGSVFLVRESAEVAKLRLLLVDPAARGLGIGRRLVEECIRFARRAGYARITLWTNDVLEAAGGLYRAAGFRLVAEEPHSQFGPPMVGQTWELDL